MGTFEKAIGKVLEHPWLRLANGFLYSTRLSRIFKYRKNSVLVDREILRGYRTVLTVNAAWMQKSVAEP